MSTSELQKQWAEGYLSGSNMAYVDGLYEDYLNDPDSVDEPWKKLFAQLPPTDGQAEDVAHRPILKHFLQEAQKPATTIIQGGDNKQYRVAQLLNAYRSQGHHAAKLNPLEIGERETADSLKLAYHNLSEDDLDKKFVAGSYLSPGPMPLRDIIHSLQKTYCSSIGIEYMHISNNKEREWLQEKMESRHGEFNFDEATRKEILLDLIAADGLEHYLGKRFVGQKRFSLEGGDSLIPMLQELINRAGAGDVKEIIVGMAHRGRLNVLVNVLGKEPNQLFEEFDGKVEHEISGDVKYHLGFSADLKTKSGNVLHLALAFNPSHLEIIGPVVEGSARSRLRRRQDLIKKDKVLPVVLHGDAAFAAQGVVMETFNFSQARGYSTGGTVHIVINNQIGFTTSNPLDARSTLYCTDVAKMVQAPIIHVNGEDPEAVLFVTQLAFDYRMKFKRDIVIDLVCYRRHGHNEADEPSVTQPIMYNKINGMKPLREKYARKLIDQGLLTEKDAEKLIDDYRDKLDKGEALLEKVHDDYEGKIHVDWDPFSRGKWTDEAKTSISEQEVQRLGKLISSIPKGFTLHPFVKRLIKERNKMASGESDMNWGFAETMAYASLLQDGYGVRISGQDSARGTFGHRHAVLHDAETGEVHTPLDTLALNNVRSFLVIDSVLSEEAVLAFEYGYSASEPFSLVIWEAQFGDFANGAQVVIDQFISSGEQKWGRLCGLVMLLPHGYEGQGPEHSSARLERFMQLCAQQNIQVCTPTTPSQIFHLLRRQMLRNYRKPLIVMSPKSLLRHKLAVSPIQDLSDGHFYNVIGEMDELNAKKIKTVVLCCGKVYYDLLQKRRDDKTETVAIIRIEQLYPFPKDALRRALEPFCAARDIVWCQEEPKNQGVWFSSQHNIQECLNAKQHLRYAGRAFAAAPAVGSPKRHNEQQKALVNQALYGKTNGAK